MPKNRPYTFYDTTSSICSTCLRPVEAKIIFKDDKVYMDKWCSAHGTERVLMSDDVAFYRTGREVYVKDPEMPQQFNAPMKYGCPYDCGLCPDHMQHSCLTVIELTDQCNLNCPICYAESGTNTGEHRSFEDILKMLDAPVANEGAPDVVQLSGGEPTLHPRFFDILTEAKKRPIKHLMINTNGIRLAKEPEFCERIASFGKGIEIYLQFDSFEPAVLKTLRGADLTSIRMQALENLNRLNISTTLVVTLQKGVNDHEIGKIIEFGLKQRCVRGVTLQPIQNAGRVQHYDPAQHRLLVSEIRRKIAEQTDVFTLEDVIPVPCNPDTLAMAYAIKLGEKTLPLTRFIDPAGLIAGGKNTIVFENDPELKGQLFKLFSTNHSPESQAGALADLLCCLPKIDAPHLSYENVFRVLIVQFMDVYSMDIRALKKSCVHIAQPDGKMIPFETYNIFHRGQRKELLSQIRQEISEQTLIRQKAAAVNALKNG